MLNRSALGEGKSIVFHGCADSKPTADNDKAIPNTVIPCVRWSTDLILHALLGQFDSSSNISNNNNNNSTHLKANFPYNLGKPKLEL